MELSNTKTGLNSFNDPFGVATLISEANNNIIHFRMETSLGGPRLIRYYYWLGATC